MPVHCSNCAQDFCSEFDSGLMIDPKIVTVPLAPAYELNCAQAPDRAAPLDELDAELPPPLLLLLLLLLLHAARASTEAPITAAAAADRLFISGSPICNSRTRAAGRYRFVTKQEKPTTGGIVGYRPKLPVAAITLIMSPLSELPTSNLSLPSSLTRARLVAGPPPPPPVPRLCPVRRASRRRATERFSPWSHPVRSGGCRPRGLPRRA